jgi:hypothetical protein
MIRMREHFVTKNIKEALDRTAELLWPPRTGIWLRISIIALFLGGGMINPFRADNVQLSEVQNSLPGTEALSGHITLFFTVLAGFLVAGLIYVIFSAIFQFIFVDCLSSGEILLTRRFSLRWRKGLHLVGFYLILLTLILTSAFAVALTIIMPALLYENPDFVKVLILLTEVLLILLITLIPVWIIAILTADFVVPVMIVDDCGIITGWRRIITLFHGRWTEAGIYTALKIFLTFLAGIILGTIIFLISIPLGIIGDILTIGAGYTPMITPAGVIRIGLATVVMILISLLLMVPVITFFRYYSLAVLRDLDPFYSLLPDYQDTRLLIQSE